MGNLVKFRFPLDYEEIPGTKNINALFSFKAFLNGKRGSPPHHLLLVSYRPRLSASPQDKLHHAFRGTVRHQLYEAFHRHSVREEERFTPCSSQHPSFFFFFYFFFEIFP